jgi:hypothetical protein
MLIAQYGGPVRTWWNAGTGEVFPWDEDYADPTGQTGVRNTVGAVHTEGHPFFEALGENRRACITCHQPANAMGLSAATVRERWTETSGKDPLFAAVDGSNCPSLPQEARNRIRCCSIVACFELRSGGLRKRPTDRGDA